MNLMKVTTTLIAASVLLIGCAVRSPAQSNVLQLCDQQTTSHCFNLKVPATISADFSATWPGANAAGYLKNDGAGNWSWTAATGAYLPLAGGTMTGDIVAENISATNNSWWIGNPSTHFNSIWVDNIPAQNLFLNNQGPFTSTATYLDHHTTGGFSNLGTSIDSSAGGNGTENISFTNDAVELTMVVSGTTYTPLHITHSLFQVIGNLTDYGNLTPGTDNTYTLGDSSHRWSDFRAVAANIGTLTVSSCTGCGGGYLPLAGGTMAGSVAWTNSSFSIGDHTTPLGSLYVENLPFQTMYLGNYGTYTSTAAYLDHHTTGGFSNLGTSIDSSAGGNGTENISFTNDAVELTMVVSGTTYTPLHITHSLFQVIGNLTDYGNLTPGTDNTYTLGDSSHRYSTGYVNALNVNGNPFTDSSRNTDVNNLTVHGACTTCGPHTQSSDLAGSHSIGTAYQNSSGADKIYMISLSANGAASEVDVLSDSSSTPTANVCVGGGAAFVLSTCTVSVPAGNWIKVTQFSTGASIVHWFEKN